MNAFTLQLLAADQQQRIEGLISFVGEDGSGSFGILAGHQRLMTSLVFGLARFRCGSDPWQYLAVPGALLYFVDNQLQICTRRYLIDSNYEHISGLLQQQLVAEEERMRSLRDSVRQMEDQVLRRLWELGRQGREVN